MAENSKIEWCDHTFNPWLGCTKVSAGCQHCYAEDQMDRRWKKVDWGPTGARKRTSPNYWQQPIKWNKKAEKEGRRYRVFCASLADVFEDKPDQREEMNQWRADLFTLIDQTPNLDWLLLTKRPENVQRMVDEIYEGQHESPVYLGDNVWLGTSVENQEQADRRVPELLKIEAAGLFLSMEPLLGPVDLTNIYYDNMIAIDALNGLVGFPLPHTEGESGRIDWVIVGGESGRNARPMHPDWARSIREQCAAANIPFLFKQWGRWLPVAWDSEPEQKQELCLGIDGKSVYAQVAHMAGFRERSDVCMRAVGKKAAGNLLDGSYHLKFPMD